MKFPLMSRAVAIAAVALAVLFPLSLVTGKIAERQQRARDVESAFARETSGPQTVVGPLLALAGEFDWPHPTFSGAFSPDRRTVGPSGFDAAWRTTHFATGGRSAWQPRLQPGRPIPWDNTMGFRLADPVNLYSLSYRATEYGFLFVLFTFAALALAEVMAGVRLRPVQYALVGCALSVFFLLLIALAEHIAFDRAYLAAATACVTLLTYYLRHPLGTRARTGVFLGLFVAFYGALYALLRSEDRALLAGSLLVFGVLAVGMIATRRIDWHGLASRLSAPAARGAQGA